METYMQHLKKKYKDKEEELRDGGFEVDIFNDKRVNIYRVLTGQKFMIESFMNEKDFIFC